MKKIVITILALLFLPSMVLAVNEVVFDSDTNIEVGGVTLVIKDNSVADQVVVNTNNIQITLSSGSSVTITSSDRRILDNTLSISSSCAEGDYSTITLPAQSTVTVVTVTPLSTTCIVGGSSGTPMSSVGGGGTPAPSTPSTNTGQVTATASLGGKTTLTTDENTTAKVDLPANAVSASTDIQIANQAKATVTNSRPVPSGKTVVGGYVYEYTATANGEPVSSFNQTITISLSYTDEQISDLEETDLKIVYWKESDSQWVVLSTLVFSDTNTLTATTDHFTYFAILGDVVGEESEEMEEETVTEGSTTINEGDLVRNPNTEGMAQFDIYIVKMINNKKFKRLILSPHVFESYEHFDKNGNGSPWDDVKDVSQSIMDEYTTSDLVRAVGDDKVYKLTASGDTGTKKWLNMTAKQFTAQSYDSDSIYEINATDRNAYTTGSNITI